MPAVIDNLDRSKIIASVENSTKIKKITIPPSANLDSVAALIDDLQNNKDNIINGVYKVLYFAETFNIDFCRLTYIFSTALANEYFLQDRIYEVKSGEDENSVKNIVNNEINENINIIANGVVDKVIDNDDILQKIAIKVIDHMHLNGVDFTYAPTIARVTIIDANGNPINLDFEKENGIYQATADLNGRFTIQLSTRDNL